MHLIKAAMSNFKKSDYSKTKAAPYKVWILEILKTHRC